MNQVRKDLKVVANRYMKERNYKKAIQAIERILSQNSTDDEALYMIAAAYLQLEDYKNAIRYAKLKISMQKDLYLMETYLILGYAYHALLDYEAAIDSLKKLIVLSDRLVTDHNRLQYRNFLGMIYQNLGSYCTAEGFVTDARVAFLKASKFRTNIKEIVSAYSSYLLCLHYGTEMTDVAIFQEHQKFQRLFQPVNSYQHIKTKKKKILHIGYISPDFRQHVMLYFYYQLFMRYDKNRFRVTCYSLEAEDVYTEKLKTLVDGWRDVRELSYEQIASIVYEDKIDILVDLAGHAADSGLAVLAYKPAPIQVSGLGYVNTTGLSAVDYFLTDAYVDPIGQNDNLFMEKLVRLPHSHLCYTGRSDVDECKEAPCIQNGFITFCSFNHVAKITNEMLVVWREILRKVPKSKLVFKDKMFISPSATENFAKRLRNLNFSMEQIEFREASPTYMNEYLDMDIALDTYPYPGGGTTCEALYMGVPVITLAGRRHGSRFGYSILKNVGLEECIAFSKDEYEQKAVAFACDPELLDILHKNLRILMQKSPVMNAQQYVSEVETAYQKMWKRFLDET